MAEILITEPIKLFDGFVENVSLSSGYGAESSTCQLTLVYEGDGPGRSFSPEDNFPKLGTCVGLKVGACEFIGIFQRYTNKRALSGYRWDLVLESPSKLLDGIQIIIDGFQGTAFTGANPYQPGLDPVFTNQINNIWNIFAVRENYEYGGIFGGSDLNNAGFPGLDALTLIEEISRGIHPFGGNAVFGESVFEVDLTELKDVIGKMNNSDAFRIKGPVQSLNSIIQEACDLIMYDYIVTIAPKSGVYTNGVVDKPIIKIKMIDKSTPPDPGAIKAVIDKYEREKKLISADTGKELSDAVTQKLVIGGPATRYFPATNIKQLWGKTKDIFPEYVDYIVLDDGRTYPITDEMEVRCAMGSLESWILYHLIKQYKKQLNPIVAALATSLFSVVRLDDYTVGRIISGKIKINDLVDTTSKVADERAKLFKGETVREKLAKIHSAIDSAGKEYYGKKFLVPLPSEAGGLANNLKFLRDDQEFISSWDIADSAFTDEISLSDVSFYDADGKLKAAAVWNYDPDKGDYTEISGNYAFGAGGIAATINVEREIYWAPSWTGSVAPHALVEIPGVNYFDQYTTEDNGLYWLLNKELGIGVDKLKLMAGFGADGVTLNFPIAPIRSSPIMVGIPQQSSRYSWGPWWDSNAKNGKAEVVVETSLSPETYGGYTTTNEIGFALTKVMNAEVTGVESGFIELAELPIGNIGERFAVSGPYVTNISISIGLDGVKTSYKFNTWTPQFGKLAKYNADRIARINKATIKFLQEQRSALQKPGFKAPKYDLPISKLRLPPNIAHLGGLMGMFGLWQKTNKVLNIQGHNPNRAMGAVAQDYKDSYGCSNEQFLTPIAVQKTLGTKTDKPTFEKPTTVTTSKGKFEGGHVGPTAKELNPYFTHDDHDFQTGVHGDEIKDKSLNLQEHKKDIKEVRTMGLRGPMMYSAWGRNLDGSAVPPKASTGADKFVYATDVATDRSLWKSGPLDLKWDEERMVWGPGIEMLEGILTSNILAPTGPTAPTTFTIDVYRTKNWDKSQAETITCTNRDASLSVTNKSGLIYVAAVRINYEWRALWIGCPELIK